ncbi:flagellar biosynthetic protein FliR [Hyphomonas sp.]|uniref:flagellar biosynthetic protein FliR n=1 Tax=Hyphomonas sp. TaxID=87 RepID=UPI003918C0FE
MPLGADLGGWVALMMIIIARYSFVIFFMPGIGEQTIPVRVRAIVLTAVAVATAGAGVVPMPDTSSLSAFFTLLMSEVIIGLALGALVRLSIWMLAIAGTVIAQSIGLAQFLGFALEQEAQTLTANMLSLAGAAILLAANFHVAIIAGLIGLYSDIPLGAVTNVSWPMIYQSFYAALSFALMLAWPFVVANLLYNICLGFINKALPSLMVAFVGAPFLVSAGAALLAIASAALLIAWKDRAMQVIGWL